MSRLEEQIDVEAPARVAWECLHDVEAYPRFVDGVSQAEPRGQYHAHLDLLPGGRVRAVDAEISDRGGDQLMMWQTTDEPRIKGSFTLLALDDQHTRVQARVEWDPAAVNEEFGGPKGFAQSNAIAEAVRHDLEHFRDLVESRR